MIQEIERPRIWTQRVSDAWRLPEDLTVSEFADKWIVLDENSAQSGQWRTDYTPYLRGIMDAFKDPLVEDIVILASTQVGKTASMLNMLMYAVDQDPGPCMWVDMNETESRDLCDERIIPLVKKSRALSRHLTARKEDVTKRGIRFDRMNLKMAWSTSPATLASRAIRYLFLNEINKYPTFSGKEADPIKLAKERTRTFFNRKRVSCSTPTLPEGYITREYAQTDQRRFYVPCPHCGHYQVLLLAQVRFPKEERDPLTIQAKRLAYYECEECKGAIYDIDKRKMLLAGRWVPEGADPQLPDSAHIPHTKRTGFWLNCLYSPWLSFSDVVAEWLSCKNDPELLMNFINSWLAEEWEENLGKKDPDQLKRVELAYPEGVVPAEGLLLTAMVDVQLDHFYVVIRAWGYYGVSYKVLSARVEDWAGVEKMLFKTVYPAENNPNQKFAIRLATIDANYRTSEVYDFVRRFPDVARATIGKDHLTPGSPIQRSTIDKYPNGKPLPGGVSLYRIDTNYYKDKLNRLIQRPDLNSLSGWYVHAGVSDDYVKQMCSEHKVIVRDKKNKRKYQTVWQKIKSHGKNHYWDCEVGNVVAADMLYVFQWAPPAATVVHQPKEDERAERWIPQRQGWLQRGRE